jgi:Na+-translocating ferredoxin:NAD+ oxidoreductase subunit G
MREMIQMIVVLLVLSCVSGGLLAGVRNSTKDRIVNQQLQFVKGPAITSILEGATNNPISDRFKIKADESEVSFFVGVLEGNANGVVLETFGKGGYSGDVGLMVGIDTQNDKLLGVGVTIHGETPGMGAKAKDDPTFVKQFKNLPLQDKYAVTGDGGKINAISGATMTSRAICNATGDAVKVYKELKLQIAEKLKAFGK